MAARTGKRPLYWSALGSYVKETGKAPVDALCDLLIDENLPCSSYFTTETTRSSTPFCSRKIHMGTDGIYFPNGAVHPRLYGSAGRLLGPCVRDHTLFSLEDAVYKLSGYPAQRFGVKEEDCLERVFCRRCRF